jgi:predicted 3-demethylubiquinone-9 3-methyltransferase (glyoxalase superfamily)
MWDSPLRRSEIGLSLLRISKSIDASDMIQKGRTGGGDQFEASDVADQRMKWRVTKYGPTQRPRRSPGSSTRNHKEQTNMKPKNTICLWFDKDAHEAARFYAVTFPDSKVTAVHEAPGDYPGGKKGDVLTVEFTVLGIPCLGLNGGPAFRHTEAFSFQIATDNQDETDRYWNAIVGNGGTESQCGWCKDRWGLSWQITPRALTDALAAGGSEAKRAFEAMMTMKKIDIAAIEAARRG